MSNFPELGRASQAPPLTPEPEPSPWRLLGGALLPILVALIALGLLQDTVAPRFHTYGRNAVAPGTILATLDAERSDWNPALTFPPGTTEFELLVWDYAAEDGDWVQIKVDGLPVSKPFMLLHTPHRLTVPFGASLSVVGIEDGDGRGITYAIHLPRIQETIFSSVKPGLSNTYELKVKGEGGVTP